MRKASRYLSLLAVAALIAAGCSKGTSGGGTPTAGAIQRGGDLIIARTADSTSMDLTTVFDNESIWLFEQIYEMLYTVTPDGKSVRPWLATSYTLSPDHLTWTFKLRPGVKFSNGNPMTSADVKFSLDAARTVKGGWSFIDSAMKSVDAPDASTVVITTKFPWSPLIADLSLFSNGILPNNYGGISKKAFLEHPVGTGPFVWDHWTKGKELKMVKNPNYWQKGKPYLDSITWTDVGDDNTRILQLKGGQAQINEFPPWSSVASLKSTPGVTMTLFPSTRTDYMLMNEQRKPFDDVHVRRAISFAIDRGALVKAVTFSGGTVANSFMPPTVPFYDPQSPGLQFNLDQAKQEMAQSSVPKGFSTTLLVGSGVVDDNSNAQIIQQELAPLGIKVDIKKEDTTTAFTDEQNLKYDMGFSYWTMDIADPDELVTFAVDAVTAQSFFTTYKNQQVIDWTHQAEREFDVAKRQALYNQIQTQAANDAFMVFMYYSPYRYAYSDKVHGFLVTPLANYHAEDIWLSS